MQEIAHMPEAFSRPVPTYKPFGHIIQLDWSETELVGGIHLPKSAKSLPFYRVLVLEVGPEVKMVKKGDHVIIPSQVILTAKWDGYTAYFSSEDKILAVCELTGYADAAPAPAE